MNGQVKGEVIEACLDYLVANLLVIVCSEVRSFGISNNSNNRFAKWVVGAEPVKTAQSTIIILQFNDFSSDLTHFLAQTVYKIIKVQ